MRAGIRPINAKSNKPTYIDLFAGCGGLSLGLHNAGWKGLFAIEKSPDAFRTLEHNLILKKKHFNWPNWLPRKNLDINYVLKRYPSYLIKLRNHVDLVVGGPPCQGFSTAGRRQEDDVRNGLINSYLKFISYVRPKVLFFENVRGFTLEFKKNKSKGLAYSEYVLDTLRSLGYEVEGQMVDFSKFGIPQKRTRFILVGVRRDVSSKPILGAMQFFDLINDHRVSFLQAKNLPLNPTVGNAISDLLKGHGLIGTPDRKLFMSGVYSRPKSRYQAYLRRGNGKNPDSHSFANHSLKVERRFKYIIRYHAPNRKLNSQLRKKLSISKHTVFLLSAQDKAPTITTLPDDYVHYSEPRILTVREYARIQSFPDWYEFKGKYTTGGNLRKKEVPRYTQIGNAIPPLFGEQCGAMLKKIIK